MKESKNEDINLLYKLTNNKNKEFDLVIYNTDTGSSVRKWKAAERDDKVISHLNTLKESNKILEWMKQHSLSKYLQMWKKMCETLPKKSVRVCKKIRGVWTS